MEIPSIEEIQAALESPVVPPSDKERIAQEEAQKEMGDQSEILLHILENTAQIKYLLERTQMPQPAMQPISQMLDG